jgi:hypothetical protein
MCTNITRTRRGSREARRDAMLDSMRWSVGIISEEEDALS